MDVGAHIGFFSILASELVSENGYVFSFEPTPSIKEVLELNLATCSHCKIVAKAAWSSATLLDFYDFGVQFSAFNTAVSDRLDPEQKKQAIENHIQIEAITLDSYCTEQSVWPDLIKIDVESAEMQVLEGLSHLLDKGRPVVSIEVGDMDSTIADGVPRSRDILEYAIGFDYLPLNTVAGHYLLHELQEKYVYDNIILVPREKLPARIPLGHVSVQKGKFF